MTAKEQARSVADKLKKETVATEEVKEQNRAVAIKELDQISSNPTLLALYKANANLGAANLGGAAPYLRIHTANSTSNQLSDGSAPKYGSYFYAPTREEYPEVICNILTVSRGFKVERQDDNGEKKLQYNQLVAGLIDDGGEGRPFLMYINGLKCRPLWDFGKDAHEYTQMGIPLFALTVRMTAKQIPVEKRSPKWIPVFEIVKDKGVPILVSDVEIFRHLQAGVIKAERMIANIIATKAVEKDIQPVDMDSSVVDNSNDAPVEDAQETDPAALF